MTLSRPVMLFMAAILSLAAVAALALVHLDNARLRRAIAQRKRLAPQVAALQTENVRLKQRRDAAQAGASAGDVMHQQLAAARQEIDQLERAAQETGAERAKQGQADFEALATNRDPLRGQTRAEYFEPKGQASPQDAFQTAIWAALKGDEATLANTCTFTPATRAQADQLLARLPESSRKQWTAEKLIALWMMAAFNEIPALQLTGQTFRSADDATVRFRIYGDASEEHVNLKLRPVGWQVVLPSNAIDKIEKRLQAAGP